MLKYYVTIYDKHHKLQCWREYNNKHEADKLCSRYNTFQHSYSKVERKEDLYEKAFQHRAFSQHS